MKPSRKSVILACFTLAAFPLHSEVTFTLVPGGDLATHPTYMTGIAPGDFDNDGFVDIAMGGTLDLPTYLFHNNGDGTFTRVFVPVIDNDFPSTCMAVIWGDYDNDGDLDLYISNYEGSNGENNPSEMKERFPEIYAGQDYLEQDDFYRNEGNGEFTRINEGAWVNDKGDAYGAGSAWVDYDRDGHLDLFVGNAYKDANFLYHNNGDGTMTDVGGTLCEPIWETHGTVFTDCNNDGWPDLIMTGQPRMFYRNNQDGTFTVEGPTAPGPWDNMMDWGLAVADYDNDGDMDFAVASRNDNALYNNDGTGQFTKVNDGVINVQDEVESAGISWGDYDNDGYQDLYILNPFNELKNFLYHNNGDGTFTKMAGLPMLDHEGYGWVGEWIDIDNDGDLDLLEADGTTWPFTAGPYPARVYLNDGTPNNWLILKLEGTQSNRDAIGTRVYARAVINGAELLQTREVMSGTNTAGQSDRRQHFGLGDAPVVDSLEIRWPSGEVHTLQNVPANQILSIVEAEPWAGWPQSTRDGDVDSGDFLDWINVNAAPWIWCYNTDGWIYCPEENVNESGAWIYFSK